jgi:hypothetical protein
MSAHTHIALNVSPTLHVIKCLTFTCICYGLFRDADSSSDYITSNDRILKMKWKECERKRFGFIKGIFWNFPQGGVEGLNKESRF